MSQTVYSFSYQIIDFHIRNIKVYQVQNMCYKKDRIYEEEFEDTKEVIRIRKSMKG
jgi:hypothetical protein